MQPIKSCCRKRREKYLSLVSFAAVIRVVTSRNAPPQWGGALRDDPNNGCEGD